MPLRPEDHQIGVLVMPRRSFAAQCLAGQLWQRAMHPQLPVDLKQQRGLVDGKNPLFPEGEERCPAVMPVAPETQSQVKQPLIQGTMDTFGCCRSAASIE